jgi:hypothetical protein
VEWCTDTPDLAAKTGNGDANSLDDGQELAASLFPSLVPVSLTLLVELGLDHLALVVVAAASVAKQGFDAVQELLLPLTDLDGLDLISSCQLGEGPGLLGRLQRDPSLVRTRDIAFVCPS